MHYFKKSTRLVLALLMTAVLFTACEEEDETSSCAPPFSSILLRAVSVDGEDIPYKTFDIDANNYQRIESVEVTVFEDGTWESEIRATNVVSGQREDITTNRNGTYECGFGQVVLTDTEGNTGATIGWTQTVQQSSNGPFMQYLIRFNDNGTEFLFIYEDREFFNE
jgi:hypothetical protein